jgi:hypothetical protein
MVNLAPQGPPLKCMVQEFAVPIVVGPSSRESSLTLTPGPTPASQACSLSGQSVVIVSQTLLLSSLPCLPVLFCAARDSPRLHHRLLAAPATTQSSLCGLWYSTATNFVGSLVTPTFSSFRGRLAAPIPTYDGV